MEVESEIRSVLRTFENFHKLLEHIHAFSQVSKEDVKDFFKLAIFIERAVTNFKEKNCMERFISVLQSSQKRVYDIDFYCHACDCILLRLFGEKTLKPSVIDVAVRMYTTLLPKERLEKLLTNFILTSASCHSIIDYAVTNKNVINKGALQAHIILQSWINQFDEICELEETINNMLSIHRIQSSLPLFIKILILDNTNDKENQVKQLILQVLLSKMMDRSILSKAFWMCIFRDTDKQDLAKFCTINSEFLLHLSKFIVYLGSMMIKSENVWYGDPNLTICPEITFNEMLMLIRALKDYHENLKLYLGKVFRDAAANTGLLIWKDFTKKYIHEFL